MIAPQWFATGHIASLSAASLQRLMMRGGADDDHVVRAASESIAAVRQRGDSALREFALRFDGAVLGSLEIPMTRAIAALDSLPGDVRRALEHAATNIE